MKLNFVILLVGLMASSAVLAEDFKAKAGGSKPPSSSGGPPKNTGSHPPRGRGTQRRDLSDVSSFLTEVAAEKREDFGAKVKGGTAPVSAGGGSTMPKKSDPHPPRGRGTERRDLSDVSSFLTEVEAEKRQTNDRGVGHEGPRQDPPKRRDLASEESEVEAEKRESFGSKVKGSSGPVSSGGGSTMPKNTGSHPGRGRGNRKRDLSDISSFLTEVEAEKRQTVVGGSGGAGGKRPDPPTRRDLSSDSSFEFEVEARAGKHQSIETISSGGVRKGDARKRDVFDGSQVQLDVEARAGAGSHQWTGISPGGPSKGTLRKRTFLA